MLRHQPFQHPFKRSNASLAALFGVWTVFRPVNRDRPESVMEKLVDNCLELDKLPLLVFLNCRIGRNNSGFFPIRSEIWAPRCQRDRLLILAFAFAPACAIVCIGG